MKGEYTMKEIKSAQDLKDIDLDFILEYVGAQGEEDKAWLKGLKQETIKSKKTGKERHLTFFNIKSKFIDKYFPQYATTPKEKKPSMWDKIDAL